MSQVRILIVEDDVNISNLIKYHFEKFDYTCDCVSTGKEALDAVGRRLYNLILLDIMLPEIDGFKTCELLKQNSSFSDIPIVMVTAKDEEADRILGFELGIDDYIIKPFSPRELALRIKAILKRKRPREKQKDILIDGKIKIDITHRQVTIQDKMIPLTSMEFKLLATLMQHKGKLQKREKLLSDVWNISTEIRTRTVDTHIKKVRQKLGQMGRQIETVRGYGYRFEGAERLA